MTARHDKSVMASRPTKAGMPFRPKYLRQESGSSNMSELFIVVALHAKAGKEEELRRDLIAVVEPSRKEEGNLRYELFVDQSDAGRFVFVEHWASH
jgi:hypothetical protein